MKTFLSALSLGALIAIAGLSPALADGSWGCAATNGAGLKGRSGSYENEKSARLRAMSECESRHHAGERGCHILACREDIVSKADADRYWPLDGKW